MFALIISLREWVNAIRTPARQTVGVCSPEVKSWSAMCWVYGGHLQSSAFAGLLFAVAIAVAPSITCPTGNAGFLMARCALSKTIPQLRL